MQQIVRSKDKARLTGVRQLIAHIIASKQLLLLLSRLHFLSLVYVFLLLQDGMVQPHSRAGSLCLLPLK